MSEQQPPDGTVEGLQQRVDDLEAIVEALRKRAGTLRDETWGLEEENEQLRSRVDELEGRVADLEAMKNPNPSSDEYATMDRDTKVQKLRLALVTRAADRATGKAKMEYNEVLALFDHHPSSGHVYDLMRLAADLDGFAYRTPADGNNTVRVDLDRVKDQTMLSHANKRTSSGGR